MKIRQRLLLLLLSVLTVSSALVSCSSQTEEIPETDTTAAQTTAQQEAETQIDYLDTLPTENLGGISIRFIAHHGTHGRINFPEETMTGEVVNDALFERNALIAEKYSIVFENNVVTSANNLYGQVLRSVKAGGDDYDAIIADMALTAKSMVLQNYLLPYRDVPYVDLSQKWWSQYNADLAIAGNHYFPTGVITPQYFNAIYLMLFNQQLADAHQLPDLYSLVMEGKWTIETLQTLMASAVRDLNGDGSMGTADQWALCYDEVAGFAFYFGAGGKMTQFDEEKMPYLTIGSEEAVFLVEKLRSIVGDKSSCMRGGDYGQDAEQPVFQEGRALFTATTMNNVRTKYREMENDFGMLPMPKYDEDQKEYYSYIQPWSGAGVAIPVTITQLKETGLILEAMAYLSDTYVREAMYNTALKEKIARDERTGDMLDIISAGARFDLNVIFDWGGSAALLRDSVLGNNPHYVSSYEAVSAKAEAVIRKTFASFQGAE